MEAPSYPPNCHDHNLSAALLTVSPLRFDTRGLSQDRMQSGSSRARADSWWQLSMVVGRRGKASPLQEVLNSSVDVDDIARFCIGRFWRIATPEQQQQYIPLFHDLLTTKIADHLGEYEGVRVTQGSAAAADTEIVITTVERPRDPTQRIDWVVSTSTGEPKIIELLSEGTSLRLTQSSDFAAYLARNQYNIYEMFEAMRQIISGKDSTPCVTPLDAVC